MSTKIAENILFLQQKSGKTKKAFAEKYGIKDSTFSSYISGRATPPIDVLLPICEGEGVSLDWITGRSFEKIKITASQVAEMIFNMKGTYALGDADIKVYYDNNNEIDKAVLTIPDTTAMQETTQFLEMFKKISDYYSVCENLNQEQSQMIKDSIIAEYSSLFLI